MKGNSKKENQGSKLKKIDISFIKNLFNFNTIQDRLVMYLVVLAVVPIVIFILFNSFFMRMNYSNKVEDNNVEFANSVSAQVESFIGQSYAMTEQLALNKGIAGFNPEDQKDVIMSVSNNQDYLELVYVQGSDGVQTASSGEELEEGDLSGREWFAKTLDKGKGYVSSSYYSTNTNMPVITVSAPVYDDNEEVVGVVASDIKFSEIQNLVDNLSQGSKTAFVLDSNGAVIAYPSKSQVSGFNNYKTGKRLVLKTDENGDAVLDDSNNPVVEEENIEVSKDLQKVVSAALSGKIGTDNFKDNNGVKMVGAYQTIEMPGDSDDWAVVTIERSSAAMRFIKVGQLLSVIFLVIAVLVIVFVAKSRVASTIYPITRASESLQAIAEGNFLVDIDENMLTRKDEIGLIARSILTLRESLSNLVSQIFAEADNIQIKVDDVMVDISQLNSNLEGISETTIQLSSNTEETAAASEQMTNTAQEIEKAAQSITKNSERGTLTSNEISERAQNTKTFVETSIERASKVLVESKEDLAKALEEVKVVEQINAISTSIMEITKQTNLLSLNASIEAARAGEAGRGFSVVAREIGKLAEESQLAVIEIKDVTTQVIDAVDNLANSSNKLMTFVSNDVDEDYNNMLNVASEYNNDANFIDDLATDFSATSEELLASIENLLVAIDGVSVAANESASGTTEITAQVSEASVESNNVVDKVEDTKRSSDKLREEVSKLTFEYK